MVTPEVKEALQSTIQHTFIQDKVMPTHSSLAADCWQSNDKTAWQAHLNAYPLRILQMGKDHLPDLDRLFTELGPRIKSRRVAHVTAIELTKIVEWKLTRGKWRPRLLDYAKAHNDSTVVAATTTSFRHLDEGDITAALSDLTKLKGIGPATASAVLSAYAPEICPFMSDEAAAVALPGVKLKYNRQEYDRLSAALCAKAEHLNSTEDASGEEKATPVWTASEVERALWSATAADLKSAQGRPTKRSGTSSEDKLSGTKRIREKIKI